MSRESQEGGFPPWMSGLEPAPGELRILHAFVSTADLRSKADQLASPRALGDWLARWGLLSRGVELQQAELERALAVRRALHALLLANNRFELDEKAVDRLDREAARAATRVRFATGGTTWFEPASDDLDGALGQLFAIVAMARSEGLWRRLKACANRNCRTVFYDVSANRSGKWCSKQRCGNRINARNARRKRGGRSATSIRAEERRRISARKS